MMTLFMGFDICNVTLSGINVRSLHIAQRQEEDGRGAVLTYWWDWNISSLRCHTRDATALHAF